MVRVRRETSICDSAGAGPGRRRHQDRRGRGQPGIGALRPFRTAVHPLTRSAGARRNLRDGHGHRLGDGSVAPSADHRTGVSLGEAALRGAAADGIGRQQRPDRLPALKPRSVAPARPCGTRNGIGAPSFPSGHTLVVAAFATAMVICLNRIWPGSRKFSMLLAFIWIFAVAASRLVLGVHWPTDVLVSICIGMFLPLATGIALESWHA